MEFDADDTVLIITYNKRVGHKKIYVNSIQFY